MDNMIYIKIDNDTFYDDAIVLVRSFYPRMEVRHISRIQLPQKLIK